MDNNKVDGSGAYSEPLEILIKSKQRVKSYGEVFTPGWIVEKMLDELRDETDDIYKTILEPSAGNGNFLIAILTRKLAAIERNYAGEQRFWDAKALFALSSIYGIEIQLDNVAEARAAMMAVFEDWFAAHGIPLSRKGGVYKSAVLLTELNIVWGDALMKTRGDCSEPIVMHEWKPAKPKTALVERIPFRFDGGSCDNLQKYKIVNIKKIHKEVAL